MYIPSHPIHTHLPNFHLSQIYQPPTPMYPFCLRRSFDNDDSARYHNKIGETKRNKKTTPESQAYNENKAKTREGDNVSVKERWVGYTLWNKGWNIDSTFFPAPGIPEHEKRTG